MEDTERLLHTTDAMEWANTFCKIVNDNKIDPIDPGYMVGWFAWAFHAQELVDKKEEIRKAIEEALDRSL